MDVTLFDIILIVLFSQGLFLIAAIQLIPNKNKTANRTLTLLLTIATVLLFGRLAMFRLDYNWIVFMATFIDIFIFLFGPFFYTYIRQLTTIQPYAFKLTLWHYIPAAAYLIYFLWILSFNGSSLRGLYNSGQFYYVFLTIEFIGILSMIYYCSKSYVFIRQISRKQEHEISYNQNIHQYIIYVLVAVFIFIVIWVLSFVNTYFIDSYHYIINYNTMWISTCLFMYVIGFFSLTQPNIFRIPVYEQKTIKTKKSRLNDKNTISLTDRLNHILEEDKIYLKSDLSLKYLSEKLNTSANDLSWLINNVHKKSFYEFINEYRIRAFLNSIEDNEHKSKTLLAIAMDVGFNSKSTFNKSFKAIMKDTPSNYIKKYHCTH